MKRVFPGFILIVLILSMLPAQGVFGLSFVSDWAKGDYEYANVLGIIPEKFAYSEVRDNVTREEFCEVALNLYKRISGKEIPKAKELYFTDTYSDKVNVAFELKLISGRENGLFAPDEPVTRQEIAKIFENILTVCGASLPKEDLSGVLSAFPDVNFLGNWAKAPMSLMVKYDVIRGIDEFLAPQNNVTREQSIILSARFHKAFAVVKEGDLAFAKPRIILPSDRAVIDETGDLIVGWMNDMVAERYTLYLYDLESGDNYYKIRQDTTNTIMVIPAFNFEKGRSYAVCIAAEYGDGEYSVYSDYFILSAGEPFKPVITNKQQLSELGDNSGQVTVSWTTFDIKGRCRIEVYEGEKLAGSYEADGLSSYSVTGLKNGGKYSIRLYGKDDDGNKTASFDEVFVTIPAKSIVPASAGVSDEEKYKRIFPDGEFEAEEQAAAVMKTITINVWKIDKNGNKYASSASVTVHKNIADDVYNIFEEIFNGAEKFPIKSVGGYHWRQPMESGRLSHHNYGTAIDINPDENYCLYSDGSFIGKYWKPGEDPYSIPEDGDVVRAFAKYGFKWGGTAWKNPKDYMHFSYLGL